MIGRLLFASFAFLLVLAAPAGASITCGYRAESPAGPQGNVLVIHGGEIEDLAAVARRGERVRVTDDQTGQPITCSGPPATVHNVDRIRFFADADGAGVFVSQAGGLLAPGASPEPSADEIEIVFVLNTGLPGNLGVSGTRSADHIRLRHNIGGVGISLNQQEDNDAEIQLPRKIVSVLLRTGRGADRVVTQEFTRYDPSLSVYSGPGNDRVVGGAMPDFIFGRAGRDYISAGGGADEVDCGPARDTAVRAGRDRFTGCERIRRAATPRIFGL